MSPRAKRINKHVPDWVMVLGACLALAQPVVAIVWLANTVGDPKKVTYLVTGESSDAMLTYYTPDSIETDTIAATKLPFRMDFQADGDEYLRVSARNDEDGTAGALTCTILVDGKVVEQDRSSGTSEASCSGTAKRMKPVAGAKLPPLTGAITPEVQRLEKTVELKRYPGTGARVVGRVTDAEARLSYAELGRPWEPFSTEPYGPYTGSQKFETEAEWQALIGSRVVDDGVMGAYSGPNRLRDVAAAIQDARQFDGFREGTTGRDVASQPFKVSGRPAWVLVREMHFEQSDLRATMDLSVVVVVDTGQERPSSLWIDIPNTHQQYWADVNTIVRSLRVVP
ncbi:MmpS family transport accessory protein [Actinomadura sediminis]|uniref:MmpS family transport accessory protein n=1 Tax=Actinomadura sediminis TaxID=1038904 RepID=A0ABW3ENW0_9ACTN